MVWTAGIKDSVKFVVVSVRVQRGEHGLCFWWNDELIVVEKLNFLYWLGNTDSFSEQCENSVILKVDSELFDTVLSRWAAGKDGLAGDKEKWVNCSFDELLKLIKDFFIF